MRFNRKLCAAVLVASIFPFWLATGSGAQTGGVHDDHRGYYSQESRTNSYDNEQFDNHHGTRAADHPMEYRGFYGGNGDRGGHHHMVDRYSDHGDDHRVGRDGYGRSGYHHTGGGNRGHGGGC